MLIDRALAFPGTLILEICLIRYLDLIISFPIPNTWGQGEMRKGSQLDLLFRSAGLSGGPLLTTRSLYRGCLPVFGIYTPGIQPENWGCEEADHACVA